MSQRDSGYARKERDCYETPEWVTLALLPHVPERVGFVWEPAAGGWKMVDVLAKRYGVNATDIDQGFDFLQMEEPPDEFCDAIITNPPYNLAVEFIRHAIDIMWPDGFVAMLLRTDFDHAATRSILFNSKPFAKKIVLTKRIKWFEDSKGSPSFNHAWFIWDWKFDGPPTLAYAP